MAKIFHDFIRHRLTQNDSVNCKVDTNSVDPTLFHRNTTKHHIQNHDSFDEENYS